MKKQKIYKFLINSCVLLFLATNLYASAQSVDGDVWIRNIRITGKDKIVDVDSNKVLVNIVCDNNNFKLESVIIKGENGVGYSPLSKLYIELIGSDMLYVIIFDLSSNSNQYNTIDIKLKDSITKAEHTVTAYFPEFDAKIVENNYLFSYLFSNGGQCLELTNNSPNDITLTRVYSTLGNNDADILPQEVTVKKGKKHQIKLGDLLKGSEGSALPKIKMQYKVVGSNEDVAAVISLSRKPQVAKEESWWNSAAKYVASSTITGAVVGTAAWKIRGYFAKPSAGVNNANPTVPQSTNLGTPPDSLDGGRSEVASLPPPVDGPSSGTVLLPQPYNLQADVEAAIRQFESSQVQAENQIIQEELLSRNNLLQLAISGRGAATRIEAERLAREAAELRAQEAERQAATERRAQEAERQAATEIQAAHQALENAERRAIVATESERRAGVAQEEADNRAGILSQAGEDAMRRAREAANRIPEIIRSTQEAANRMQVRSDIVAAESEGREEISQEEAAARVDMFWSASGNITEVSRAEAVRQLQTNRDERARIEEALRLAENRANTISQELEETRRQMQSASQELEVVQRQLQTACEERASAETALCEARARAEAANSAQAEVERKAQANDRTKNEAMHKLQDNIKAQEKRLREAKASEEKMQVELEEKLRRNQYIVDQYNQEREKWNIQLIQLRSSVEESRLLREQVARIKEANDRESKIFRGRISELDERNTANREMIVTLNNQRMNGQLEALAREEAESRLQIISSYQEERQDVFMQSWVVLAQARVEAAAQALTEANDRLQTELQASRETARQARAAIEAANQVREDVVRRAQEADRQAAAEHQAADRARAEVEQVREETGRQAIVAAEINGRTRVAQEEGTARRAEIKRQAMIRRQDQLQRQLQNLQGNESESRRDIDQLEEELRGLISRTAATEGVNYQSVQRGRHLVAESHQAQRQAIVDRESSERVGIAQEERGVREATREGVTLSQEQIATINRGFMLASEESARQGLETEASGLGELIRVFMGTERERMLDAERHQAMVAGGTVDSKDEEEPRPLAAVAVAPENHDGGVTPGRRAVKFNPTTTFGESPPSDTGSTPASQREKSMQQRDQTTLSARISAAKENARDRAQNINNIENLNRMIQECINAIRALPENNEGRDIINAKRHEYNKRLKELTKKNISKK